MNKKYIIVLLIFSAVFAGCKMNKVYGSDADGNVVVVIDPGHGGLEGCADDGAAYNDAIERNINLIVAKSMYAELLKYEGVKVYLTHDSADESMTLGERAEFAKSVNADFLYSIHFNASEEHNYYGAEVWIPASGQFYVNGYQFASIELGELTLLGLFSRGIKTRIGTDDDEYYGIIRECKRRDISAVIIEHCYLDNDDVSYFNNEDSLNKFGVADATAAAKYFNLKNSENNFELFSKIEVDEPIDKIYQDSTQPEVCEITLTKEGKNSISINAKAKDNDSYINYYSYSLDGGNTFSRLYEWNDNDGDGNIKLTLGEINVNVGKLVIKVYNKYDISKTSNILEFSLDKTKIKLHYRFKNEIIAIILIVCGIVMTFIIKKNTKRYGKNNGKSKSLR